MVQLGESFDTNQVEPRKPLDVLKPGWYAAAIVRSENKESKANPQASYLELEFELDERYHPELKGRKLFDRLNLWNPNAQTVQIARATLSSIGRSVGVPVINDTDQLHMKPLAVKVRVKPADGNYAESNVVSDYDALAARFQVAGAPAAAGPGRPAATAAPAAAAAPAKAPWQR